LPSVGSLKVPYLLRLYFMRETWRSEMLREVDMEGVDSPRTMALTAAARVASLRGRGMVAMQRYKILRYEFYEERQSVKNSSEVFVVTWG